KALVPLSPREARAATRRARRRQPLPLLPSTLPPLERPQAKPGGRNDSGGGAPYLLSRARRLGRCHDRKEVSRVQRSPVARSGVGRTGSGPHRAGSGVSAGGDGKEARAQRGARKRRRKWRRARRTTFARRPVTLPSPAAQVPVQIRARRTGGGGERLTPSWRGSRRPVAARRPAVGSDGFRPRSAVSTGGQHRAGDDAEMVASGGRHGGSGSGGCVSAVSGVGVRQRGH
ncbi:hypothetical protein EE612_035776, partial [Oryza sativa]